MKFLMLYLVIMCSCNPPVLNQVAQDVKTASMVQLYTTGKIRPSLVSIDGKVIEVGPIETVALIGEVWRPIRIPATVHTADDVSASKWYYLYVETDTVGGFMVTRSSSQPDQGLRQASDRPDSFYIGAFRTDAKGVVLPFYSSDGKTTYAGSHTVGSFVGVPTFPADVSMASLIPPHARRATMTVLGVPNGNNDDVGYVDTKGITASGYTDPTAAAYKFYVSPQTSTLRYEFEIQTDASQMVRFWFHRGGAGSLAILDVRGYTE